MMPYQQCTLKSRKKGIKWGESGTCYPDKADAEKQRKAIMANAFGPHQSK
jgi:hypothetical protein